MPRKKAITKKDVGINTNLIDQYIKQESERTGMSAERIIQETFKDGFLIWTVDDTRQIADEGKTKVSQATLDSLIADVQKQDKPQEAKDEAIKNIIEKYKVQEVTIGGGIARPMPYLTAWTSPPTGQNDSEEYRRLRKDFTPVSKGIDYLRSVIIGNNIDVVINDPTDKNKTDAKEDLQNFMKNVYQDSYTISLYTILSILLDETLTVGNAGAQIAYETPVEFKEYVEEVKNAPATKTDRAYTFYKTKEPDWKNLKTIVQLRMLKNAIQRLKLYRNNITWEDSYWTLDEVIGQSETVASTPTAIPQADLKSQSSEVQKFLPWQIFWLNINRREFGEYGTSVIEPVKYTALLLERILQSVGEGIYRAGNKKYFIVCGTEKRPWSKPHIRNVMQQIQEMGKKNWTNIPVPYGFDIKEIGGSVFEAESIINYLLNLIAEGLHVPLSVIAPSRQSPEGESQQSASTFNEVERMRYEFKQAVEQQLFKKELWCLNGKTRTKQGGAVEPMYIPELEQTTKGLQAPIERMETIIKLLNVANPVAPETKLELDRELSKILGYDDVKMKTQEELRKELEEQKKMKEEKDKMAMEQQKLSLKNAKEGLQIAKEQKSMQEKGEGEKTQGQPEPPSLEKQEKRLDAGVSTSKKEGESKKGIAKNLGGPRVPKESK